MRLHSGSRRALTVVSLVAAISWSVAAQPAMELTGVRLDDAFKMPGSNASGLVFSVTIRTLARPATTGDFIVVAYDDQGRPNGEMSCLAIRSIEGPGKHPWLLLSNPGDTWPQAYKALTDSGAAVVERTRKKPIAATGRYEFAFVIGPSVKRGALLYGENRPDVARMPIGPFKVPWP